MSNQQLTVLAGVVGLAALAGGLLIRAGHLRWWLRTYWDESLPTAQRAGGLVLLPAGVLFLVGVAGVFAEAVGLSPFGVATVFAALIAFIVFMPIVWSRPPSWLKPDWLREQELRAKADPSYRAQLVKAGQHRYSPSEYRNAWIGLVVVATLSVALSWPPAVLLGLGIAGAALYARRPRDQHSDT